jgi:hypothetical protein
MMIEHSPDGICPLVHVVVALNAPDAIAVNAPPDELPVVDVNSVVDISVVTSS